MIFEAKLECISAHAATLLQEVRDYHPRWVCTFSLDRNPVVDLVITGEHPYPETVEASMPAKFLERLAQKHLVFRGTLEMSPKGKFNVEGDCLDGYTLCSVVGMAGEFHCEVMQKRRNVYDLPSEHRQIVEDADPDTVFSLKTLNIAGVSVDVLVTTNVNPAEIIATALRSCVGTTLPGGFVFSVTEYSALAPID